MSFEKTQKKEIFYKSEICYSITINPDNKHQGNLKSGALGRIAQVKNHIWTIFNQHPDIRYILYPDISEPLNIYGDKYPRIHFHGIIMFKNNEAIRDWLLIICYKLKNISYVDIDTLGDPPLWREYCLKYMKICNVMPLQNKLKWPIIKENKNPDQTQ